VLPLSARLCYHCRRVGGAIWGIPGAEVAHSDLCHAPMAGSRRGPTGLWRWEGKRGARVSQMLDLFQSVVSQILVLPLFAQLAMLLVLFLAGPLLLIPILAVAYATGLLLGFPVGLVVTYIGYMLATVFYYELGASLCRFRSIERVLRRVQDKYLLYFENSGIFGIAVLAVIFPLLLLVPLLGLFRMNRLNVMLGLLIGASPSLILAVQAGGLSHSFWETYDISKLVWSTISLIVAFILNKVLRVLAERSLNGK